MKLEILILDAHCIYRNGLSNQLLNLDLVNNVTTVETGEDLKKKIAKEQFDMFIIDISTSNGESSEIINHIKSIQKDSKIIAISFINKVHPFNNFLELGVDGYLIKSSNLKDYETAIQKIVNGGTHYPESLLLKLIGGDKQQNKKRANGGISKRELEVLNYISKGYSRLEIADFMEVSQKTVDKHRENLLKKTKSKNIVTLALQAYKEGIISD